MRTTYNRPREPEPDPPLSGQLGLFGEELPGAPRLASELANKRAVQSRLLGIKAELERVIAAIDVATTLLLRGITLPDVAEAIGLPSTVPRVTAPLKPWRLRAKSNMDVIATMLEEAGRKGVAEDEMVGRLREIGRLADASDARRSVHWTITELQRRTRYCTRGRDGRWRSYGTFGTWRKTAARIPSVRKSSQKSRDRL
jgi:hypothetical protein